MTTVPPDQQETAIDPSAMDEIDATVVMDAAPTDDAVTVPGYEILKTLGRGGMGMVYLARQTGMLDREVALKTILPRHEDQVFRRYFLKEGQRQAQLHHPNILPIFAAGEAGEMLYLSMYFARDGSLRDRIDAGTLSVQQSVDIICGVLAALNHAHNDLDAPMAHLDVKPENILFDGENVFLADFGIAKTLAENETVIGGAAGDPRYWPPEQQNDEATTRSDLYALGVMFFEMLVGSRPPAALKSISTKTQVKDLARELPAEGRPFAPIIARCLNPDPDERPEAQPMARELRQLTTPRRTSMAVIATALLVVVLGAAISQPGVRDTLADSWNTVFPPQSHALAFAVTPVNGKLWIDGQEEALRNLSLTEGTHRVAAVAPGYQGETAVIQVAAGSEGPSFDLAAMPPVSDREFQRFISSFDGSDRAHSMEWNEPTLQNVVTLDQLQNSDRDTFNGRVADLRALATAGDAVASTSLFYAAFEGIAVPDDAKALMPGLIRASEGGYAVASLLRALYVIQSLLEAEQTFNDNPFAFEEVEVLLVRASEQGLPDTAARVAAVAGIGSLNQTSEQAP